MGNLDKNYVSLRTGRSNKGSLRRSGPLSSDDGSGEPRVREASVKELWTVELRSKESI